MCMIWCLLSGGKKVEYGYNKKLYLGMDEIILF